MPVVLSSRWCFSTSSRPDCKQSYSSPWTGTRYSSVEPSWAITLATATHSRSVFCLVGCAGEESISTPPIAQATTNPNTAFIAYSHLLVEGNSITHYPRISQPRSAAAHIRHTVSGTSLASNSMMLLHSSGFLTFIHRALYAQNTQSIGQKIGGGKGGAAICRIDSPPACVLRSPLRRRPYRWRGSWGGTT